MNSEEEREEINPLANILQGEKTASDRTVRTVRLERKTTTFHMYPNIAQGFRTYARLTGKTISETIEAALIEYMQNHPTPQIKLNIQQHQPNTSTHIQTRLRNKILTNRMQGTIQILRHLNKTKTGDRTYYQIQLRKLVLQAANNRSPDDLLLELMKEAEDYI